VIVSRAKTKNIPVLTQTGSRLRDEAFRVAVADVKLVEVVEDSTHNPTLSCESYRRLVARRPKIPRMVSHRWAALDSWDRLVFFSP
jgi:hypothetical protein